MKAFMAARLGLAIAGIMMVGAAGLQAQGGNPGFAGHRPPMERALGPQDNHGNWWNNPAMVEKLKLTDAQRKSMDDILLQHRETLVDLRGNVQKSELVMESLLRDDQPNEAKILGQIDKVAQARAELEKANARFLLALRGKLTPEQWKALQAQRANRREQGAWGQRNWEQRGPRPNDGKGRPQMTPPPPAPGPQGMFEEGPGAPDMTSADLEPEIG
jgi:Spy/CpxP family protein refolding chaperone